MAQAMTKQRQGIQAALALAAACYAALSPLPASPALAQAASGAAAQAKPEHARRLVGLDVAEASVRPGAAGQTEVLIKLGPRSQDALSLFTKAHVGKEIEMVVDGQPLSRIRLAEQLTRGELVLTGQKEAQELASRLSSRQATLELRVAPD